MFFYTYGKWKYCVILLGRVCRYRLDGIGGVRVISIWLNMITYLNVYHFLYRLYILNKSNFKYKIM